MNDIIIFKNILRFDGIIFIVGIVNIFIYYMIKKNSRWIYKRLHPKDNIPLVHLLKERIDDIDIKINDEKEINYDKIENLFEKTIKVDRFYNLYVSLSSIFPLLGITGTVLALLSIKEFGSNIIENNFLEALTSTFWGIVWGALFKVLEGIVIPDITRNELEIHSMRNIFIKNEVELNAKDKSQD